MDVQIYYRVKISDWDQFVASKFAKFLYKSYKGEEMPEDRDALQIARESIDSDTIFSFEDKGNVIGMTSIKLSKNFNNFKKAIYIREISVAKEYRGKGLSKELRKLMVKKLKPDIVLGVAHNPISVVSREKLFTKLGFLTYWGNLPVGDYKKILDFESINEISREFISKVYPLVLDRYSEGVIPYHDANIWAEATTNTYNKNVEIVLKKVLKFQKANNMPAMATLISIKQQLS